MIEASNGKVGTIVDKLVLFCFHFDPKGSKYTLAAFNVMRAGALLTVLLIAIFMIPFWLRSRRPPGGGSGSSGGMGSTLPRNSNELQGEA